MTDIKQLPQDFLKEMRELLKDEYEAYMESFGEPWKPGLRINTWKAEPGKLKEKLPWQLSPVPWTGNGFYYETEEGQEKPSRHPFYYAGLYYLQEPSAMAPAAMLPVEPGDKVLDLCAAPGGKSTELAARLQGRGLLVSNDISYSRARALLKNLELTGAPNICVLSESPERLAGIWPEFFDKILVDAPCSGEGMFRRDEDMVKDWQQHGPDFYAPLQRQIAGRAVEMLRPGGMLLYSTCTFSKKEDEETIQYLLDTYPQLELIPLPVERVPGAAEGIGLSSCLRLFPHRLKGEGHFLALLRKKEGLSAASEKHEEGLADIKNDRKKQEKARAALEKQPELLAFLEDCRIEWDYSRIAVLQENVYYLPQGLEKKLPLRFLRTGLFLGELKKGRFEPSQAFAMALKEGQYPNTLNLSLEDERVIRYLKGETIALDQREGPIKGWCLVTLDGFSLGWAKGSGMNLKNKYYPGWRWQ